MKVMTVVGNRPQFIKSAPLSLALRAAQIEEVSLHTGQHWDAALSEVFYAELTLERPRYALDRRSADPELMRPPIVAAVAAERPDWVLVFGDTNSTAAGARAGVEARVPVAHVEAGLRSGDLAMPEERNRIEVDAASALLLCPDARSQATLAAEGVPGLVVGDDLPLAGVERRGGRRRRGSRSCGPPSRRRSRGCARRPAETARTQPGRRPAPPCRTSLLRA